MLGAIESQDVFDVLVVAHVASAIVGPESLGELEANISAADLELSAELLEAIDQIGRPPAPGWAMEAPPPLRTIG